MVVEALITFLRMNKHEITAKQWASYIDMTILAGDNIVPEQEVV
jgi:hypothetical protein